MTSGRYQSLDMLAFVPIVLMPVIMLVSGFLFRDKRSGPEQHDGDDGEGGGGGGGRGGPDRPVAPQSPRGDIPLPDARPASYRLRDHRAGRRPYVRERRPAREPRRAPLKLPR